MKYEIDNRDITTTELVLVSGERIEVNPMELYRNALENAGLDIGESDFGLIAIILKDIDRQDTWDNDHGKSVQDLRETYGPDVLNERTAKDLHSLIQRQTGGMQSGKIDDATYAEYLQEAEHGSWDGWDDVSKVLLDLMMIDLVRFHMNK